jgi:hypothetical protein
VKIRGCPPSRTDLVTAYGELGIELPDDFLEWMRHSSETYLKRYAANSDFDDGFYRVR